jgi:hypothetical protein
MTLPRMFVSEADGWRDLVRSHPSVAELWLFLVIPLALIPPLMHAFAQAAYPGSIFPSAQPPLSAYEAALVGVSFFCIELLTVALMAAYIRQVGDLTANRPYCYEAFTLAAVTPIPLWLSSLALFIPSLWVNLIFVAIAWIDLAALIRHGVLPLFCVDDQAKARSMANDHRDRSFCMGRAYRGSGTDAEPGRWLKLNSSFDSTTVRYLNSGKVDYQPKERSRRQSLTDASSLPVICDFTLRGAFRCRSNGGELRHVFLARTRR